MFNKSLIFLLLGIFYFGISQIQGQSVVIQTTDGSDEIRLLSSLQSFWFDENNLMLNIPGGSSESLSLNKISKIYFKDVPMGITNGNDQDNTAITIYPNPATQVLHLKMQTQSKTSITIYAIDGVPVSKVEVATESPSIDVSYLANGLYLLKMNNQVLKFQKQ